MGTPAQIQASNLVRTIQLLYSLQDADTVDLAMRLQAQRKVEWVKAISAELQRYGCPANGQPPAGSDAQALSQLSLTDARSIANTYNRELGNQVQRLYAANPRGNRNYYFKALETWSAKRQIFKGQQIALNTHTSTGQLARQRFRQMNDIDTGKFIFAGPIPVCIKCVRLRAMGIVSIEIVNRYGDSQHVNCPHFWKPVRVRGVVDCKTVWRGA